MKGADVSDEARNEALAYQRRSAYETARAELAACAGLLQALAVVDLSRDNTKDAVRLARKMLGIAAEDYNAAVAAIMVEDERRRREQSAAIAAGPMAPITPTRTEEDSAA